MKIGVDLDDTICRTTEIVQTCLEKYSKKYHVSPLDVMNDDFEKEKFFAEYIEDIYEHVEPKREVIKVLKRIHNRGNKIYIITARGSENFPKIKNEKEITINWLKKHDIMTEDVITGVYGETKAKVCKDYQIDLMIDDDPYNYKKIVAQGIKCLLFDDKEKFDLKEDYVTNWLQVEEYIERNR
mgnify:CR=1 FL=1